MCTSARIPGNRWLLCSVRLATRFSLSTRRALAVLALDPNQPVARVRTMEQIVTTSVANRRFQMVLIGIFALLAVVARRGRLVRGRLVLGGRADSRDGPAAGARGTPSEPARPRPARGSAPGSRRSRGRGRRGAVVDPISRDAPVWRGRAGHDRHSCSLRRFCWRRRFSAASRLHAARCASIRPLRSAPNSTLAGLSIETSTHMRLRPRHRARRRSPRKAVLAMRRS